VRALSLSLSPESRDTDGIIIAKTKPKIIEHWLGMRVVIMARV